MTIADILLIIAIALLTVEAFRGSKVNSIPLAYTLFLIAVLYRWIYHIK